MKKKLISAVLLIVSAVNLVFAAESMIEEPTSLQSSGIMSDQLAEEPSIDLGTCGVLGGFPRDILKGIISFSPIEVRELNKAFYYLSSGYTTPGAMGIAIPPLKAGFCGNPDWTTTINFQNIDLNNIPSPVWFGLLKEVNCIPVSSLALLKGTQVHTLSLWGNKISVEMVKELKLQETKVRTLDLRENQMGDVGVKALNLQGTTVQELWLWKNQIGNEGAKGLKLQGTQVHTLYLTDNQIGDEGAMGLDLQDTKIHTLALSGNKIGLATQRLLTTKYPHIYFEF